MTWIVASFLFSWYLASFANYNVTYGSLGAVVGLMIWLCISTVVVLLGSELKAEIEHQTARDSGRCGAHVQRQFVDCGTAAGGNSSLILAFFRRSHENFALETWIRITPMRASRFNRALSELVVAYPRSHTECRELRDTR